MEKKKFSGAERYAIWKILGPNCRWCKSPVEFAECHIDHIIPEKLIEDDELRNKVLLQYGLDKTFGINSFHNWIPIHSSCNFSKHDKVIEGANIFLELLTEVKNKFAEISELCRKWETQNKTAKIITILEREVEKGTIDKYTVTKIFAGINDRVEPVMGLTGSTIDSKIFYVPSTDIWNVIGTQNNFYTLTKDGLTGVTPVNPYADSKWLCSECKNYWPWDGNLCLNCGKYSFD